MAGGKAGGAEVAPLPESDAAAPSSGRRGSLAAAALANFKALGATAVGGMGGTAAGSRRPSRMSVSIAAPTGSGAGGGGASRRGSMVPGALPAGGGMEAAAESPGGPSVAMHPGLDRIKSFNRKKSVFRGSGAAGGGRAQASFDELAAAMDALDSRIGAALQQMRAQNAAGLGTVRGLNHSKTGRLRLGGAGIRDRDAATAAAAAAAAALAADSGGEWQGQQGEEAEAYSPRRLLGAEAAERPDKFLPRIKFAVASGDQVGAGWVMGMACCLLCSGGRACQSTAAAGAEHITFRLCCCLLLVCNRQGSTKAASALPGGAWRATQLQRQLRQPRVPPGASS